MVHALLEAHRVLKDGGLLIDLRPAAVHRRVGTIEDGEYKLLWRMREGFDNDHPANLAVAYVIGRGLFKQTGRTRFPCFRTMDNIGEFREWLVDFVERNGHESHDWLDRRLEKKLAASPAKPKIVVSAPSVLRVLRKQ